MNDNLFSTKSLVLSNDHHYDGDHDDHNDDGNDNDNDHDYQYNDVNYYE